SPIFNRQTVGNFKLPAEFATSAEWNSAIQQIGNLRYHKDDAPMMATAFSEFVLFSGLKIVGVFSVLMFIVMYAVWVERKVSASIQDRRGPNRVGIFGLLQPLADMIKAFLKEDFTPGHVRTAYYWLARAIVTIP